MLPYFLKVFQFLKSKVQVLKSEDRDQAAEKQKSMPGIGSTSGMENENLNVLSADNPLKDPKDDRLGYAPFARNLAESICRMAPPEGFVIAVYGPWGSGKSTLLNFLIYYLEQKSEDVQPIIVPFNPWWFSGQEDLQDFSSFSYTLS